MNEVYIWKVKYETTAGYGATTWRLKVLTKINSFKEAERVALKVIETELTKKPKLNFIAITKIKFHETLLAEF